MKHYDAHTLSLYIDGELALPVSREVETHLRGCSTCTDELHDLRRMDRAIAVWARARSVRTPEADRRFWGVLDRRRGSHRILAISRMMPAAVGSSIAALLVLVSANLGVLSQNGLRPNPPQPQPVVRQHALQGPSALTIESRTAAANNQVAASPIQPRMAAKYRQMFNAG